MKTVRVFKNPAARLGFPSLMEESKKDFLYLSVRVRIKVIKMEVS